MRKLNDRKFSDFLKIGHLQAWPQAGLQYGRNFEAICKKISCMAKMHGFPRKGKMQVCLFYKRCWARISKFINLDENSDVDAATMEMYGMINYGALRIYVKETDPEFGRCLNELIYCGETIYTPRVGMNRRPVKVRTPKCTYLTKINRAKMNEMIEVKPLESKEEEEFIKPKRISKRLSVKRNRLGESEDEWSAGQTQTPQKRKAASNSDTKQQRKKPVIFKRKPPSLWTCKDKKLFFLFLGEYGKNFEAISKRFAYNSKMRGDPEKDRMQVQYFYYRMWAQISKFVYSDNSDAHGSTRELYGLINYGTLRGYITEAHPEFEKCLNQLIYYGETVYTSKTKRNIKIRSPRCTYLKKINKIQEKRLPQNFTPNIPNHIMLELTPKNSTTWAKVQELSQNPRIRFKLSTNRTLESVLRYLGSKWKSNRNKLKETMGCKEDDSEDEEIICTFHPSSKIEPFTFIPQELPKMDISFNNYRENILPLIVKRKRPPKVNKDQEKHGEEAPISVLPQSEIDNRSKSSVEEFHDSLSIAKESENVDINKPVVEAMECELGENKESSKCSFMELSSPQHIVPNLPEDDNAVFLDLSKFPQPTVPDNSHKSLPLPSSISTSNSPPPPSQSNSVIDVVVPQSIPSLSVPPCLSSPSSSSANVILSPSVQKKKQTKSATKRTLSLDSKHSVPQDICDIKSVLSPVNTVDFSLDKSELELAAVKAEAEREFERLTSLAYSGFSLDNTNNVTLLHLCLLLGKASLIRMEYEWKEKEKLKSQILPDFCRTTSQMANVLRRLCNIAQLELTSFQQNTKMADASKAQSIKLNVKKKVKDVATMTVPIQHTAILRHPNGQTRTFIAANAPQTIGLNGNESVFRVPFVPAYRPPAPPTKEEQEKLKLHLQEQQAQAIIQQIPFSKQTRLLKKRNAKRKPIIVQRTLLPKIDNSMITYIQGPPVTPQVIVNVKTEHGTLGQPIASISPDHQPECPVAHNGSNIMSTTANVTKINELTAISQNGMSDTSNKKEYTVVVQSGAPSDVSTTTFGPVSHLATQIKTEPVSTISSQADITLSDFDISLNSTNISNMGPDAGDKFLDSVLQNSQQGFSGLINSTKKVFSSDSNSELPSISVDTDLAGFSSSILRTPPHSSSSYNPPPSSLEFPSPMNLNMTEQPWMSTESGDISLSSILGESSSFHSDKPMLKTPTKSTGMTGLAQSVFFDNSSSDAVDTPTISSKPSFSSDVSLSCLLNDSNLGAPRNVESLTNNPTNALAVSKESLAENLFSSSVSSEAPPSSIFSEASQDSFAKLDVDVTFQGMVSESSMDFVKKFETLAAHITGHDISSKLNTPIKKECDFDENDQAKKVDSFASLSLKNI